MLSFILIFIPIVSFITINITFWWLDISLKNRGCKNENSSPWFAYAKDFSKLLDLTYQKENSKRKQYQIALGILISSLVIIFGCGIIALLQFSSEI